MGKVALLVGLVMLMGCAKAAPVMTPVATALPAAGSWMGLGGEEMGVEEVAKKAAGADYVLIGEGHDSACDHAAQAALVKALVDAGRPPAVGFEMIPVGYAEVLGEFNKGRISVAALPEVLDWEESWGFPFALYEPIFRVADENGLPVYALNVPSALARKVGKEGMDGVSAEERAMLPATIIPPLKEQRKMLRQVFESHPGERDDAAFERFMTVQSLWDTVMAENAVAARKASGRPVAVIAGAGHVEYGWGIAHRLRTLDPGAKIFVAMPWRAAPGEELAGAEAFFYCPQQHKSRMGMLLEDRGGRVVVAAVVPGSRAQKAGLAAGDVVVEAQGLPVAALADMHDAGFKAHEDKAPFVLTVERAGTRLTIDLGRLGEGN